MAQIRGGMDMCVYTLALEEKKKGIFFLVTIQHENMTTVTLAE